MKISVVVTTCNGHRYIEEQLTSILTQRRPPDQVVVADDGSIDGTAELVETLAQSSRISFTVLRGIGQRGLRSNVTRALEAATGDVLVLADQDDRWRPDKLSRVENAFGDPAISLWFSNARLVDPLGKSLNRTLWDSVSFGSEDRAEVEAGRGLARLLYGQTVTGATMAIRRDVIPTALPLPIELEWQADGSHLFLHDGWLAVIAYLVGDALCEPETLVDYRRHAGQVTAGSLEVQVVRTDRGGQESSQRVDLERVSLVYERVVGSRCERGVRTVELAQRHDFLARRVDPRVGTILDDLVRGRYARYAAGARSAVLDLLKVAGFAARRQ